jgi:predicted house-cleaning noncanonical NTP pyrophosphatase (MazG superfamily)
MKIVYNKLVRDKMIDIWKQDIEDKRSATGYSARYMEKAETLERLKDKLIEESQEVFEAYNEKDKTHLKEEIADVIEVIDAILYHNDITLSEVLAIRDAKKEKKGGFETGLFLESIDYIDGKEPK